MNNISVEAGHHQNGREAREARNLAEKNRRDKLNASIQELARMVPHVADSTRRLDKTAVLRFATHGLRLQYVFGNACKNRKCIKTERGKKIHSLISEQQTLLTDSLMQLLDSFFLTLTCHGQIVLMSRSIESLLGYCQSDLYGQNILNIMTHPDDQNMMRQQLIPRDLENLFDKRGARSCYKQKPSDPDDEHASPVASHHSNDDDDDDNDCSSFEYMSDIDERLRKDHRSFTVRLARAGTRAEGHSGGPRTYEIVKIDGCFRRSDNWISDDDSASYPIVAQLIRRSRNNGNSNGSSFLQHDLISQAALHGISGNDIVFVAMARLIRPPKIIRHMHNSNLEYKTRHLIDGRIVDCDQRIGLVAGYMKEEVCNLSPFSFMHQDDVRWVIVALRQMYDCNSDYGESCYRLLSRNGNFIYLQTKGYLEIDKETNKVHSFVCINTLLEEEEGKRKVQEMKNKFSIIIQTKIPSNSLQDVPASQNPQQLERIVLYLIENLQKRHDNSQGIINVGPAVCDGSPKALPANEGPPPLTKTPLSLVPPEAASVRNSISQSVSVVNITAGKTLQLNKVNSPPANNEFKEDFNELPQLPRQSVLQMCHSAASKESNNTASYTQQVLQKKITVLKRLHSSSPNQTTVPDYELPAKRCTSTSPPTSLEFSPHNVQDVHSVITTSFQNIEHSLDSMGNEAHNLYEKRLMLPATVDHKLNAIIEEHQQHKLLLNDIKCEYVEHVLQTQQQHKDGENPNTTIRLSSPKRKTVANSKKHL